jgi:hypothetical protein
LAKATSPSGSTIGTDATGTAALVGLWASPAGAAVANLSSCSNFQWNVTSQAGNAIAGTFSAVCLGAYQVNGTASGQLNGGTVHVILNASANLPTIGACPVTLTTDGTLDGDAIRLPYVAQTCLGTYTGTETLKKSLFAPTPAPAPALDPTPVPAPAPIPTPAPVPPADEIDLNQVTIVLGPANIASWPQTATVTGTKASQGELCVYTTKTGLWPTSLFFDTNALIEGNQWVFANIGGRWYGGAGEWQRPGQACKPVPLENMGADTFYGDNMEPLRSWRPQPGEVFGVMASTPARAWPSMRTVDERSNVVLIRMGQ